jgi:mannose-6-phosphate isomerase
MKPWRLQPTRVRRFYRGGALLGPFRGGAPEPDGELPEDWICSTTTASLSHPDGADEGLSRLEDGRALRDAIAADPESWLGRGHLERFGANPALLVKLLDPSERLPVHAHPSRAFARTHLGSDFGKTEAWIVIGARRQEGEAFVGLREPVEPKHYRDWIERQDADALLASLNRVALRPGDVLYVPAGVPHAIGGGLLIVELQEPTDLSLVCEWSGFPIPPDEAHLGLGWETASAALDLAAHEPVRRLPEGAAAFFWADEHALPAGRFAALVVLEGEGAIDGQPARRGDVFAVPASTRELDWSDGLRVLRCLAPDPALA